MLCPNAVSSAEQPRKRRCALVGEVDELVRPAARLVGRADVRVVLAQVARDRVDHLVRALRASGAVEEGEAPVERGEARAHGGDVECGGAHADLLSVDDPAVARAWTTSELPTKQPARPCDELRECSGLGSGCELDLERGLDVDEGIQAVALAPGDDTVRRSRRLGVEPGAFAPCAPCSRACSGRVRRARDAPPTIRPGAEASSRPGRFARPGPVDGHVELEHAGQGRHRGQPSVVRTVT